jgi:uncharacterized membrane protein
MEEFISNLIGNEYWATLVMSFFPLIELKGAIIYARSAGIDFFISLILSYVGSTLVFIPIYFLLRPVLNLLKKIKIISSVAEKAESYCAKKAQTAIEQQRAKGRASKMSDKLLKQLGVFVFVAIPLPMTGIWTGTAIAAFLDLKFKDVILPVTLGNLVAGTVIALLAELCAVIWTIKALDYILYGLFALAIIMLIVLIIKVALSKPNKKEDE